MIDGQQQVRQLGRGNHERLTVSEILNFGNFGNADQANLAKSDSTTQASCGLGKP